MSFKFRPPLLIQEGWPPKAAGVVRYTVISSLLTTPARPSADGLATPPVSGGDTEVPDLLTQLSAYGATGEWRVVNIDVVIAGVLPNPLDKLLIHFRAP